VVSDACLYPEIRERLRRAVSTICDDEVHERLWLRGERQSPEELGFDDALLVVVDELVMPGVDDLVGIVLADKPERDAFAALADAIRALTSAIGVGGSFRDAVDAGAPWESCEKAARTLQRLLSRELEDRRREPRQS